MFDTGLGHFSLRRHVKLVSERELSCVASHTHFDHIGCHYEFDRCSVHEAEAEILQDVPRAAAKLGVPTEDTDFSDWTVPSWQDLIASLHRPDR